MLNTDHLHVVVGLGKTGYSCVRYLLSKKVPVQVTDSRFANGFDEILCRKADVLVLSPGISKQEPIIAEQIARGISVVGDIELFAQAVDAPVIAITGSNGKSTVTTLVGEMAKQAGLNVQVGGNIGTPVLDLLSEPGADLYVLELSSFQLETTYSLKPIAATILNISPDHMDRYEMIQDYIDAKRRIYDNCECAIVNRDDKHTFNNGNRVSFGLNKPEPGHFGVMDDMLAFGSKKLLAISELKIKGQHNWQNAMAALALGYVAKIPFDSTIKALKSFQGIPHRCEWVANINAVDWYNDSKATNVGAATASIKGLGTDCKGKLILIAGGQAKDKDFSLLCDPVKEHVKTAILFGEDGEVLAQALNASTTCVMATDLVDAVATAKKAANPSDIVLLAPACTSLDMFENFEQRERCLELHA